MAGAVGHISCEMIVDINTEVVLVLTTVPRFLEPSRGHRGYKDGGCLDIDSY